MRYPIERKAAVLKKMLPPNNQTISRLAKEEGIAQGTLYSWRAQSKGVRLIIHHTTTNTDKNSGFQQEI